MVMTFNPLVPANSRLRERYRPCLKEEIAQTVASPTEDELRHLFRVLARWFGSSCNLLRKIRSVRVEALW